MSTLTRLRHQGRHRKINSAKINPSSILATQDPPLSIMVDPWPGAPVDPWGPWGHPAR